MAEAHGVNIAQPERITVVVTTRALLDALALEAVAAMSTTRAERW